MTTNLLSNTKNSELIYTLACIEGQLIELRSRLRWGIRCPYHIKQIAYDFGWEQIHKQSFLPGPCSDVISSICSLADEIAPSKWADGVNSGDYDRVSYEKQLRESEEEYSGVANKIKLENTIFERTYGSPQDSAGYVYVQEKLPPEVNYCIRQIDDDKRVIAILSELNAAFAVARYAASHDGGYGDVCISASNLPNTHSDFEDWFL
ncbi:hypothetical protein AAGW04_18480 [Pectobacterium aroidearum]|uniref:hypothetical protein n=1 Tax=Pectobacterium aroidearum TaxID=1201031 RepID=UPI0031584214